LRAFTATPYLKHASVLCTPRAARAALLFLLPYHACACRAPPRALSAGGTRCAHARHSRTSHCAIWPRTVSRLCCTSAGLLPSLFFSHACARLFLPFFASAHRLCTAHAHCTHALPALCTRCHSHASPAHAHTRRLPRAPPASWVLPPATGFTPLPACTSWISSASPPLWISGFCWISPPASLPASPCLPACCLPSACHCFSHYLTAPRLDPHLSASSPLTLPVLLPSFSSTASLVLSAHCTTACCYCLLTLTALFLCTSSCSSASQLSCHTTFLSASAFLGYTLTAHHCLSSAPAVLWIPALGSLLLLLTASFLHSLAATSLPASHFSFSCASSALHFTACTLPHFLTPGFLHSLPLSIAHSSHHHACLFSSAACLPLFCLQLPLPFHCLLLLPAAHCAFSLPAAPLACTLTACLVLGSAPRTASASALPPALTTSSPWPPHRICTASCSLTLPLLFSLHALISALHLFALFALSAHCLLVQHSCHTGFCHTMPPPHLPAYFFLLLCLCLLLLPTWVLNSHCSPPPHHWVPSSAPHLLTPATPHALRGAPLPALRVQLSTLCAALYRACAPHTLSRRTQRSRIAARAAGCIALACARCRGITAHALVGSSRQHLWLPHCLAPRASRTRLSRHLSHYCRIARAWFAACAPHLAYLCGAVHARSFLHRSSCAHASCARCAVMRASRSMRALPLFPLLLSLSPRACAPPRTASAGCCTHACCAHITAARCAYITRGFCMVHMRLLLAAPSLHIPLRTPLFMHWFMLLSRHLFHLSALFYAALYYNAFYHASTAAPCSLHCARAAGMAPRYRCICCTLCCARLPLLSGFASLALPLLLFALCFLRATMVARASCA